MKEDVQLIQIMRHSNDRQQFVRGEYEEREIGLEEMSKAKLTERNKERETEREIDQPAIPFVLPK